QAAGGRSCLGHLDPADVVLHGQWSHSMGVDRIAARGVLLGRALFLAHLEAQATSPDAKEKAGCATRRKTPGRRTGQDLSPWPRAGDRLRAIAVRGVRCRAWNVRC